MNLEELREFLSVINGEDPTGIKIHLVERREIEQNGEIVIEEDIREADISEELAAELKEDFINVINDRFFNDEEFAMSNISAANEVSNSAFYYDLDELPEKLHLLGDFDPWHDYPNFSFNNNDIENVKALLVTIGNQNRHFTIYKHVYPVTIIRRDRVIGLIPVGNRFEKLNENILQINTAIDFLYVNENLIVNSLKTLTNSYGYKEIVIRKAVEKIQLIQNLNLIQNIQELIDFVSNVKYAKRILKINPESPVLQLARERIIQFVLDTERLRRRIRIDEENNTIVLDTDVSKVLTIGILNDDFLKSHLTDLDYESEKKSEIHEED
ncbi:anti-phage protein KwaB [Flavobacterium sp.]|uniref:anti-phage protein KwaB n=1 Tax=Flavobacterium sp. TaxID=239 RepID=UPI0039E43A28